MYCPLYVHYDVSYLLFVIGGFVLSLYYLIILPKIFFLHFTLLQLSPAMLRSHTLLLARSISARRLVAGLGEGPYYLSSEKLVAVSHRFDWKSCFCR